MEPTADANTPSDAVSRRPAVAVLPLENMSGDPEQEYFADGLAEDIITALSLWRSFPIIARNSTFAYKGRSPDVREAGKALGARYVVEGGVRKAGNRVRITVQLIDVGTGHHVWAERYDRELEDIFAVQDEITQRIAAVIWDGSMRHSMPSGNSVTRPGIMWTAIPCGVKKPGTSS